MTTDVKIARARGEAEAARAKLMGTVDELKARLSPQKVTSDAIQGAKNKSIEVADQTVTAVRQRPGMAAGVAAAAALFLARKPLFATVAGWFSGSDDRDTPDETASERRHRVTEKE
ncbi:DUF3618 domain-containing protein [Sphingomonas ginkgonis]|uniref:DUF3618 domain-containing protein n=1 Tax=Sphingomonas ginkgonis TaxID=2315330 RepID=A0A429VAP4_9SPHN|nr:DUF3618 domain-containing protein [Sphingomonas ginkgonis]RST31016.1 DUF3618 domain-containing protein [Sphingomonas ginkgonis]